MSSACTGMLHLTILKSMASRISRLRPLLSLEQIKLGTSYLLC